MEDLIKFLNARIQALETENKKLKEQVAEAVEILKPLLDQIEVVEPVILEKE